MPVLRHLDLARAGVEGDAATADVVQGDREVEITGLVVLVFDGEAEGLRAREHQRRDAVGAQERAARVEAVRVFVRIALERLALFGFLLLLRLEVGERIAFGHRLAVADHRHLTVLDEHGARAVALDRAHVVRHQDHGLGGVLADLGEVVVAFALERLVTDGEHLVEHEDVALRLDRHREREAHLHAARIVLELLVHEVPKLGELDDVVVHRVDLFA